jgi:CDP-glucose 4,6-dehydratase
MENLVDKKLFSGIYQGRRVLVTGHTGFKGSWLSRWLAALGAEVTGISLPPATVPSHFSLLDFPVKSNFQDINEMEPLSEIFREAKPEIVFHLAAQPIVTTAFNDPVETIRTNILGLAHIMECIKKTGTVKAFINITSDKCYLNREWNRGYKETDALGGDDPYSASKACAEIITHAYRKSYFQVAQSQPDSHILTATVRAGNVIGGGDWGNDRIIPDLVKAAGNNEICTIRNPGSVRPWQHVMDPLCGYLQLGQKLLEGNSPFAQAWNFGPVRHHNITVSELAGRFRMHWDKIQYKTSGSANGLPETKTLKLDSSKAVRKLNWKPLWDLDSAIMMTIVWYRNYYENNIVNTFEDIKRYVRQARKHKLVWAV